jgi:HTH-type transcriptional regulator, competence development regulator
MTPFGCYLEALRRSRQLQQKQLAGMLDVDPTYISLMERGRKGPPSNALLEKLIASLQLSQEEQLLLQKYVAQSPRALALPKNMKLEEYELLESLWQRLGSLSHCQIEIMKNALKMSDERVNAQRPAQLNLRMHGM